MRASTPGYRPGFQTGGPGLADLQRAAKRATSEPLPSEDLLRARAALRDQMAKGSRGGGAFAPSPEASDDEVEDASVRVVQVGKVSATFRLPPERPEEKKQEIGAALPPALKKQRKKEQERKKGPGPSSSVAAVLQQQAENPLLRPSEEEASLEARAMAGEFAEDGGRSSLWDRPSAEYVANPIRVPANGLALGRIVGQVQTHNRLLQCDDMSLSIN